MTQHPTMTVPEETIDSVFNLLKRQGPLCVSQISAELLIQPKEVEAALGVLAEQGYAESRPDRDKSKRYNSEETAWGLRFRRRRNRS